MGRCGGALGPVAAERLGEAGIHFIAGTLSETAPAGSDAAADAMRMRVFSYVRAHLDDPDLSHARVAAVHRMAPRTLTRLFQDEPVTVAEYVRNCRLEAVRRDLGDPRLAHRSTRRTRRTVVLHRPAALQPGVPDPFQHDAVRRAPDRPGRDVTLPGSHLAGRAGTGSVRNSSTCTRNRSGCSRWAQCPVFGRTCSWALGMCSAKK